MSATYTGADAASGIYSGALTTMPGIVPSDSGVILSTGLATSITNSSGEANISAGTSANNATAGDAGLTAIAGVQTFDAAILEATFVPTGNLLTIQFVFSSEEYLEYVNGGVTDSIGIWVNGVKASVSFGTGDVTIDTVNTTTNSNFYRDNPVNASVYNTEMDGLTVNLTVKAPVNIGVNNTIKIGIADGGDSSYDSNLMIIADSIQTSLIAVDDNFSVFPNTTKIIDVMANDTVAPGATIEVIKLNGVDVNPGDSVVLPTGQTLTLNLDGTISVASLAGSSNTVFSYMIQDSNGNTDVAFVNLTTAACFLVGTMIETPTGRVAIETLKSGDLVMTLDDGPQPLRWIGFSRRFALGKDAPVVFAPGSVGNTTALQVSQNHRMLVSGAMAELLFGEAEVFVKAKDMVNDSSIRIRPSMATVDYVHMLFDKHQIVIANDAMSESYFPTDVTADSFDQDTQDELERLFPELIANYGSTSRCVLRSYEARTLLGAGKTPSLSAWNKFI